MKKILASILIGSSLVALPPSGGPEDEVESQEFIIDEEAMMNNKYRRFLDCIELDLDMEDYLYLNAINNAHACLDGEMYVTHS